MTPGAGAQPGGLSPANGSGPRELLSYRSAQAAPGIGWLSAAGAARYRRRADDTGQPGDRTHAIGTWAGFSGVSAAIVPFVGRRLLEAGSWRWIFLINVPGRSQTSGRSFAADAPSPSRPG